MNATALRFGIGGNNPPISDLLTEEYRKLTSDIDAAVASASRAPEVIEDDVILGKFGDLTKILIAHSKTADDSRKAEKQPYLDAGRAVDGFFSALIGKVDAAKSSLLKRSTAYLQKKEAIERAAREAEAKKAADEQAAAMAAAERAQDQGDTDTALEMLAEASAAETTAAVAAAEARAKPADLVRTHGTGGSVSTLKKEWTFTVEDRSKIPLEQIRPYLAADAVDKAIKAFIKAGNRELAGVRIFEQPKAMVR
jgi:hypothetical protein